MNDLLRIQMAAANDGNTRRSGVNFFSLSLNNSINLLKSIAYGINKEEKPENVGFRQVTALFRQVTALLRQVTALLRQVTASFRQVTALFRQVTALLRQVTASFRQVTKCPFRRVNCAEQVIIMSCWTIV